MGLARAHAIALVGVQGHPVEIEADIENGMVALLLVGLPDTALREARDRIRAAIVNSGETWPTRRITVGLSPASLHKRGSGFDLGIAMAILAAAESVPAAALHGLVLIGELGLDGRVRPVPGVLPAAAAAAAAGFDAVAVAAENAAEAALVPELRVVATPSLSAFATYIRSGRRAGDAGVQVLEPGRDLDSVYGAVRDAGPGRAPGGSRTAEATARAVRAGSGGSGALAVATSTVPADAKDLADLVGQPVARRAAEICAAGGHHLMLLGPPGVGKTMLAERLPTVLPQLEPAAALEVTAIHSVAGTLPPGRPLLAEPPFCAPHHTATRAAIVGGGSGIIRPGAASLAHHGCLFLDEAPEFGRDVLDGLRQPLESGEVVVARAGVTARFPARFTLIMAANPCACASASTAGAACSCTPLARRRYLARLSGPLLDRVDAKIEFLPVRRADLLAVIVSGHRNPAWMLARPSAADGQAPGITLTPAAVDRAVECWRARLGDLPPEARLAAWERSGYRLVCPGDAEWPTQLDDLAGARPVVLWLRGTADLRFACLRSVSVVGSRAATAYGTHVGTELAADLAGLGWTVISGGAFGIDACAHRGALMAGGCTAAVLASGLTFGYPKGHAELFGAVERTGVMVSECPPERAPTRPGFLVRNRVIAALSRGTVVVEAALRSGALNTARHAGELNRPVMAVPGPVTSEQSAGCHELIRESAATCVTGAGDVVEFVAPLGDAGPGPSREPAVPADNLDPVTVSVLRAVPRRTGRGPATIATLAGVDLDTALRCLGLLAAAGHVERCEQGWRARQPG